MLNKFFTFTFVLSTIIFAPDTFASQESLDNALRSTYTSCVGINEKLTDLKKMAGINTAVSAVGTATATGALATGIAKAQKDKQIEELIKKIKSAETSTSAPETDYEKLRAEFNAYHEYSEQSTQELDELQTKSKKLGNWRTGLMAGSTLTNVAGALIAKRNDNNNIELNDMIASCLESVSDLSNEIIQARFDDLDVTEATSILSACREYDTVDLSKITNKNKGAMISSIVGASTGAIGTATSAAANSDSIRQNENNKKEKSLNATSNLLAGATVVASGTATVFNATQISAIKHIANVAENCERLLNP